MADPGPAHHGRRGALASLAVVGAVALAMSGCGGVEERDGPPARRIDVAAVPDAVPKVEPRSRFGNPASYVVNGKRYRTLRSSRGYAERGIASWYGRKFHGRRTSSGDTYDMYAMTAAHRTLPLPTYVRVTNLENGRSVVVRVNDRGPFHDNRLIDVSYSAAWKLGIIGKGTGYVEVRALDPRRPEPVVAARADEPVRSAPGVRLYLQAGSFSVRTNAERMAERVKGELDGIADSPVRIAPAVIDGRTTYRVRLGPIGGVELADRLVQRLSRIGMESPRIVLE